MHAGSNYTLREFLYWTRREIYWLVLLALILTSLYELLSLKWLALPWLPVALLGTAAAFLVAFKNNASYGRLWEARIIWGAIVNSSRTWGIMAKDFISGSSSEAERKKIQQILIYRHIAWLTALRFQLRETRTWESINKSYNMEYRKLFPVEEKEKLLADALKPFLNEEEYAYVMSKSNKATQIISLQSQHLRKLHEQGLLENFRFVNMEQQLADLYDQQGKCERIKNFPYPRQFATINLFFIRLFILLVPFGMLMEFEKLGEGLVWLTVPFSTMVAWVFNSIEKIGEATENPFEGGANDVPITALCRTIEIDLREMLDEANIPEPLKPVNKILM
ncbi:MAG TPA: bestrophin family ion channel [Cyclobacteriaceae bacterium]|nr:bestrophin family ion channel [Cyclobacteriaceae bacterium]